jgi:hypothetical protein
MNKELELPMISHCQSDKTSKDSEEPCMTGELVSGDGIFERVFLRWGLLLTLQKCRRTLL